MDPGRIRDAFGLLMADIDEKHIRILNTKEWWNKDFFTVGNDISRIRDRVHIDRFLCEANNQGHPAIDSLRRFHGIECRGITTVKDVKNRERLMTGNTMPKNVTVEWVEWALQNAIIEFPERPWPDGVKRLDEQMGQFVRHVSSGGMKYEAADRELHDDLVSCLLIMCHYARIHVLQLGYLERPLVAGMAHETALDHAKLDMSEAEKDIRRRMGARFGDGADDYEVNVRMPHDV